MRKGLGFHNRRSPFLVSSGPAPVAYWITSINTDDPTNISIVNRSVNVDSSGNSYVLGYRFDSFNYVEEYLFQKYNSNGIIQYQKFLTDFDNNANSAPISGIIDSSGNNYLFGSVDDGAQTSADAAIVKYNSSGVLQWQRGFGIGTNVSYEYYYSGAIAPSGNIYAVGGTDYWSGGSLYDGMISKYNASGTLLNQWLLADPSGIAFTMPIGINFDSSGNYYVTGNSNLPPVAGGQAPIIVKFNSSDVLQWQVYLDDTYFDSGMSLQASTTDLSGNIYCCGIGVRVPVDSAIFTAYVVKINSSGVVQWTRYLDAITPDYKIFMGIKLDSSNNVYVTGQLQYPGVDVGYATTLIAKYNSSGVIQWQRTLFCSSGWSTGLGITVDSSSNYYVTGLKDPDYASGLTFKLPVDGSRTGTYGAYTYAASSYIDSAGAITAYPLYLNQSFNAFTPYTSGMVEFPLSLTTTVTNV